MQQGVFNFLIASIGTLYS